MVGMEKFLNSGKEWLTQYVGSINLDSASVRYIIGTLAVVGVAVLLRTEKKKNYPPMVPYTLPLIGHTWMYKKDRKAFIRSCTEKYGPVFRVMIEGMEMVIVDKHLVVYTTGQKYLNFMEALFDITNLSTALEIPNQESNHEFISGFVKRNLTRRLDTYVPRVAKFVQRGFEKWLGDLNGEKTLNGFAMVRDIVVTAASSALVGEELCCDERLKGIFMRVVVDMSPTFMRPFPAYTKFWESFLFWYYDVPNKNIRGISAIIKPEIDRRRREREELGESWNRPCDLLQDCIDECPPDIPVEIYASKCLHAIAFLAMHTTSKFGAMVVYAMAKYTEFTDELVQEQRELYAVDPAITVESLKSMVKLDSYIRECLRKSNSTLGLAHKVLKDTKLPNGMSVDKGAHIYINYISTHWTNENDEYDEEFRPFRFTGKSKTAVRPATDYLIFGFGKHTCPGRFFAINEIKYITAILLREYEFRLEQPDEPELFSGGRRPPMSNIVFKKRMNFVGSEYSNSL
ncbi:uncharacterized protein VTP21DRAFT_4019 [Calcarisporiella thermophila]|uniref:uncharacterized protein n=1 Tax=Calcarisporiella thermophila TaxID=911321 RepID=UPI003743B0C5